MNKPREKMPVAERAKQFMPFAALRGLDEALRKKELELLKVEKAELSEDAAEELNEKLTAIRRGDRAAVTYFSGGEYRTAAGAVTMIDPPGRRLRVGGETVSFDDIRSIAPLKDL